MQELLFRGLKNAELIHRIRSGSISDRSLKPVFKMALDYEATHNSSVFRQYSWIPSGSSINFWWYLSF